MEIWRDVDQVQADLSAVVAIGVFDGVHRGHRMVLRTLVERARALGVDAVVITFDPHPLAVHQPDIGVQLIMPLEDRLNMLAATGIDAVLVIPYTLEFADQSAYQFVLDYFVRLLGAQEVIVGADVRFGRNNSGDLSALRRFGDELGFSVVVVGNLESDSGRRWSSTWVRELLSCGDVERSAKVLGRPHRVRGIVQHGHKRGRKLGFPTANLDASAGTVVPADGVYAGWLVRSVPDSQAVENLPAAISVGSNPQFDGRRRTVEAHVLGRGDLDLYGQEIVIEFVAHLRAMSRFATVCELLYQMDDDLRRCSEVLGVPVATRLPIGSVTAGD